MCAPWTVQATCRTRATSAPVTTPPAATVLTLSPEADARTHEASPTTNYGTAYLRANGGTESDVETFLRFTVTGAPAGSVQSAKLRLYNYNGTADGPALYTTSTVVERDRDQLEHPAGPHERRDRRQGRDPREHAGSSTT